MIDRPKCSKISQNYHRACCYLNNIVFHDGLQPATYPESGYSRLDRWGERMADD